MGTAWLRAVLMAALVVPMASWLPAHTSEAHVATTDPCDVGATRAWLLGVVYDDPFDPRHDFVLDVDHIERFRHELSHTYCLPDANVEVLAFAYGFERNGVAYEAATETNVKDRIASFGAAAGAEADPVFFYFSSSHGAAYVDGPCPDGSRRLVGSGAVLGPTIDDDGWLADCELGAEINHHVGSHVRVVAAIDCSFCGGFSDSLTAASGTVEDASEPEPSGMLGPNRIVMTGCSVTTECFGRPSTGGLFFVQLVRILDQGIAASDGMTAPGFPDVQGANVPAPLNAPDGTLTVSEWFFGAVRRAYTSLDPVAAQQQFRIKYGFGSLEEDLPVLGP